MELPPTQQWQPKKLAKSTRAFELRVCTCPRVTQCTVERLDKEHVLGPTHKTVKSWKILRETRRHLLQHKKKMIFERIGFSQTCTILGKFNTFSHIERSSES